MTTYPAELTYNNINPKGFFSTFKEWKIQPVANGGYYWPGQNIKILIQSIVNGVMDPYRSHLQLTVFSNETDLPVGALQVDSSAQSFIEQLVISSRNKQIERIPQYSVLAAWLTDIGLSQMYAQGRQTQGLGYNNVESFNTFSKLSSAQNVSMTTPTLDTKNYYYARSSGLIFPTQTSSMMPRFSHLSQTSLIYSQPFFCASRQTKGILNMYNPAWNSGLKQHTAMVDQFKTYDSKDVRTYVVDGLVNQTGYLQNLRAQYLVSMQNTKYPDTTTSCPSLQIHLNSQVLQQKGGTQYKMRDPPVYQTGLAYKPYVPQSFRSFIPQQKTAVNNDHVFSKLPNFASFWGYSSLYSPNFCKGTHQPFISPTIPQCQMENGKILPVKRPVSKKTFKIPLISAILGLLIPQDQFVLLPIRALNDLLIQLVIDKYAMFTSGYNDISQFDNMGSKIQQTRAFGINKITYNMHTYSFWDPQIDQYLNKVLMDRILINCNMWTLGNQYTVPKGDQITNNWPVACTSQALNEIVVIAIPSDYQRYSFCRKHFRLSNNILKFQLRVNMQYFPPMPIVGNGGNPCQFQNYDDNSDYIQQIFWSNNFMFNKVNPFPRINAYNFAINQRCYDISKIGPMYPTTLNRKQLDDGGTNNPTYAGFNNVKTNNNYNEFNLQTSMGMPWIHQNRFVGKAAYVYSFEPYAHSQNFLVGLDCRNIRQFDVLLTAGTTNSFPRQQQLYIFTRSSVIIQYTQNGISTYGR